MKLTSENRLPYSVFQNMYTMYIYIFNKQSILGRYSGFWGFCFLPLECAVHCAWQMKLTCFLLI